MWYCRVTHECDKQESHPDINLTNRIISLAVSSVDTFPRSSLLWGLYIQISQVSELKTNEIVFWKEWKSYFQDNNMSCEERLLKLQTITRAAKMKLNVFQKYDAKSLKSVIIRSIKENPSMKQFYLQAIQLCPVSWISSSLFSLFKTILS